jgi:serine/threonine protein kinase
VLPQGAKLIDPEGVVEALPAAPEALVTMGGTPPFAAPEVELEPRQPTDMDFYMSAAAAAGSSGAGGQQQQQQQEVYDPLEGMRSNSASRTYAADIWSLGMVLFELFTGSRAFGPNREVVRARTDHPCISPLTVAGASCCMPTTLHYVCQPCGEQSGIPCLTRVTVGQLHCFVCMQQHLTAVNPKCQQCQMLHCIITDKSGKHYTMWAALHALIATTVATLHLQEAIITSSDAAIADFMAHHKNLPPPARQLLQACLVRDPAQRTMAQQLLRLPFFGLRSQVQEWDQLAHQHKDCYMKEPAS